MSDRPDPTLQQRRLEALQRAQRARETLAHEAELAQRYGASGRDRTETDPPGETSTDDVGPQGSPTWPDDYRADVDHLVAIHEQLRHERRIARRRFQLRHADRLVVALELAERLALERLGFADYADFEARGGEPPAGREIIDVDHLERAARELAEAEAELTALGIPSDRRTRFAGASASRLSRRDGLAAKRRSLFARDDDRARRAEADASALPLDEPGSPEPLPTRPGPIWAVPDLPAEPRDGDDRVLGEILVPDGRTIRVEKIPGITYSDEDDDTGLRADSITYGDPRRLI